MIESICLFVTFFPRFYLRISSGLKQDTKEGFVCCCVVFFLEGGCLVKKKESHKVRKVGTWTRNLALSILVAKARKKSHTLKPHTYTKKSQMIGFCSRRDKNIRSHRFYNMNPACMSCEFH